MKKQLVLGLLLIGTTANAALKSGSNRWATGQLNYYHTSTTGVCSAACKKLGKYWRYARTARKGTKQTGGTPADWQQSVRCKCVKRGG